MIKSSAQEETIEVEDQKKTAKSLENKRNNRSSNKKGNKIGKQLLRGIYWVARLWFRGIFYSRTLRGRRPQALTLILEESWHGNTDKGVALIDGRFRFFNHTIDKKKAFSRNNDSGPSWQAELHGFNWLGDVRAVGTELSRVKAREYILEWIASNQHWNSQTWHPTILSNRLCSWLTHAEFISAGADENFAKAFLEQIGRQVKHLRRTALFVSEGIDRVIVTKALVYAALCLPNGLRYLPRLIKQIHSVCTHELLPDGGHPARSPKIQLEILCHLIDIRAILRLSPAKVPATLNNAIDNASQMLRLFCHGDGGFALFNGANEGNSQLIEAALVKAECKRNTITSALHSGFERINADRTILIADTGPSTVYGSGTHAGSLSFELSVGKQRIVVNCGAYAGRDTSWRLAQRSTAAHSTLVLEDRNSSEIRNDGTMGPNIANAWSERLENNGNTWLEMSHDGYEQSLGVIHRRRLYINSEGSDIRGQDILEGHGEHKFAVRFHLHPSVKASMVKDGTSVLLRLPDKTGWRLRCSGGIASLHESIYLGDGFNPRRSEQIIISGASSKGEASVKWAIGRLKID